MVLLPSSQAVTQLALAQVDDAYVNGPSFAQAFAAHSEADSVEVQSILTELAAAFDRHKFDTTVGSLKSSLLHTIAGPFGVGRIVSAFDRPGGNVDTVHGVRNGVYVTQEEAERFENRGAYDTDEHHKHPTYKQVNNETIESLKKGTLVDSYTGERFKLSDKEDSRLKPSLDHKIAAKTVHNDPGRVLAEIDSAELSNIRENLTPTRHSINSSIKDLTAEQYGQRLQAQSAARQARLKELSDKRDEWTDKERGEFKKLEAIDKVDPKLMSEHEDQARKAIDSTINETYYGGDKFKIKLAGTSLVEGGKMGFQQAMGEALVEFFAAVFDEMRDLQRNGATETAFLREAQVRFGRVAKRVASKWERLLSAFAGGFLSGLLSNLVTTLINVFVTTGKRLVRVIREGFLSLLRAIKLLVLRPEEMSPRQALHEASKIMVGAGIVIGGIALEEIVAKHIALVPGLGVIAEPLTAAIVGSLTAIATAVAVYFIDKADLLGVKQAEKFAFISSDLDKRIAITVEQVESAHSRLLKLLGQG